MKVLVAQLCLTLCDPMKLFLPARLLCPWSSLDKNTGMDSLPFSGDLLHCRQILYHLKGKPICIWAYMCAYIHTYIQKYLFWALWRLTLIRDSCLAQVTFPSQGQLISNDYLMCIQPPWSWSLWMSSYQCQHAHTHTHTHSGAGAYEYPVISVNTHTHTYIQNHCRWWLQPWN